MCWSKAGRNRMGIDSSVTISSAIRFISERKRNLLNGMR